MFAFRRFCLYLWHDGQSFYKDGDCGRSVFRLRLPRLRRAGQPRGTRRQGDGEFYREEMTKKTQGTYAYPSYTDDYAE